MFYKIPCVGKFVGSVKVGIVLGEVMGLLVLGTQDGEYAGYAVGSNQK